MILLPVILVLWMMGFVIWYVGHMFPDFLVGNYIWEFTYILCFMGATIFMLYRIRKTQSWKQVDNLPVWKHLMNYMRRDNQVVPVYAERAYPGESFVDVPHLGLIEFLGKDCYYTWGDKKIIWGLENINFTPDPRYFNLTHLLWNIGFNDSDDVKRVLNGIDLELMGHIYLNMLEYDGHRGAEKLVEDMKNFDTKKIVFKPKPKTHSVISDLVDKLPSSKKKDDKDEPRQIDWLS